MVWTGREECDGAGKCPSGFDRGRSDVSEWTGVEAITCGRSCVAALTKDGGVRYARDFLAAFRRSSSGILGAPAENYGKVKRFRRVI